MNKLIRPEEAALDALADVEVAALHVLHPVVVGVVVCRGTCCLVVLVEIRRAVGFKAELGEEGTDVDYFLCGAGAGLNLSLA